MYVKSGNLLSTPRNVTGGSPQGTKLGGFLFCVTLEQVSALGYGTDDPTLNNISEHFSTNGNSTPHEIAVPEQYLREEVVGTPLLNTQINENFRHLSQGTKNKKNVLRDSIIEESFNIKGRDLNAWTLMYIDDLNVGEVHPLECAKLHITQHKERKNVHAKHCENRFEEIRNNAEAIGMRINASKTQLLCVSDSRHSEIKSY